MARRSLSLGRLLRPYWRLLGVAFLAMLAAAATELAEPWPLKVIFDYVLGSKRPPPWLARFIGSEPSPLRLLDLAADRKSVV